MKYDPLTLCISNGGQGAKNKTNMNKINGSAKMNRSAENPATAHTRVRCMQGKKDLMCIEITYKIETKRK